MLCHGQGDPTADPFDAGCCYVGGQICPMRWHVDTAGEVWDSTRTSLGLLDDAIRDHYGINQPQIRARAIGFLGWQSGVSMMLCSAAGQAAVDHWAEFMTQVDGVWEMTDRAAFNTRWSEEFDAGGSAVTTGDAWVEIGKPRNWCVDYGPVEGQCCHQEDQATNDAARATLSESSVSVRSQAAGAG